MPLATISAPNRKCVSALHINARRRGKIEHDKSGRRWFGMHALPDHFVSTRARLGAVIATVGSGASALINAGVFCIPLPTHARLARDYRPHVDRPTPGDPPCRSATPSPEVVRLLCRRFSLSQPWSEK